MNKKANIKKVDYSTYAVIAISLLALFVSIGSYYVAHKAQKQSSKEYVEERWLLLKGEFEEKSLGIKVHPIDSGKVFLQGEAHLPKSIYKEEIHINSKGEFLYMGSVGYNLKRFVAGKFPKKEGYAQFSRANIPIYIRSYYAVKGQTYTDVSLYTLSMSIIISDEEHKEPYISFEGLIFVDRYPADAMLDHETLDSFVNNEGVLYIPPKAPN